VVSGETKITEMTDADVEALAIIVKDYIYNTGIGKYALSITAPVSGTWINRGAFVNKVNNLQDDPYVGAYVGSFTGTKLAPGISLWSFDLKNSIYFFINSFLLKTLLFLSSGRSPTYPVLS
jgi:hypothetical protein